ncbi:hypothetical protein CL628_02400 [bacterium]|nr:hypothetical protein [bacterium]
MNRIFLYVLLLVVMLLASSPALTFHWEFALFALIGIMVYEFGCRESLSYPDPTFDIATPARFCGCLIVIACICAPIIQSFVHD